MKTRVVRVCTTQPSWKGKDPEVLPRKSCEILLLFDKLHFIVTLQFKGALKNISIILCFITFKLTLSHTLSSLKCQQKYL